MGKILFVSILVTMFIGGWLMSNLYEDFLLKQVPFSLVSTTEERASPGVIDKSSLKVYGDKLVLEYPSISLAEFADTRSMEPIFGKGNIGLDIVPENEEQVKVGMIAVYEPNWGKGLLIPHRVVAVSSEDDGSKVFHVQGTSGGRERITFDQIKYIQIGVIYAS
ncbi:MAG: hypothetical protein HYS32_04330 [Candidatus Woesearchaeota archaeon]|nr:MAG: hypothetical protein HYS32_04330 [Candidatus Woesearchaeota archaeon]